ncbi:MAG: Acetyltransferase [Labilithrix sp.]|nr:Acetyltransferase [Labilithrix sp.]
MIVEPFAARHLPAFRALFDAAGSSCACRWWHFTGTKNEWLERSAHRPDEGFEEQAAAVRAGDPSADGLVAVDGDAVLGWMKLAPREVVPKLTGLVPYRNVLAPPGTWSIGCFQIAPAARRHGVARALVTAADAVVLARGGRAIEAYPRRSSAPLYDEEAWQGPEGLFASLGYAPVHDVAPYPMYRKVLLPG